MQRITTGPTIYLFIVRRTLDGIVIYYDIDESSNGNFKRKLRILNERTNELARTYVGT